MRKVLEEFVWLGRASRMARTAAVEGRFGMEQPGFGVYVGCFEISEGAITPVWVGNRYDGWYTATPEYQTDPC